MSREDKAEQIGRVREALEAIPARDRGSAAFAILMDIIVQAPEQALADVMQYIGFVVHRSAADGQDVGHVLRAVVLAIAGGVSMAVPEHMQDTITAGSLLQETAEAAGSPEAVQAEADVREAFREMMAASDIMADLGAIEANPDILDDLLA